ncbi:MAG: hypothetical protein EBU82_10815 [Flavobacteriia bacterium]|jgi:hypothetical protein|nr:hypothetical protein [Flavobacteriia bacterium]NBP29947.1 hypothetical protein [Flavobacteriia bacterium]
MKSCLLFLGVFFGYFSFGQKSQDTIPDLRKVITTQVVSYQVKPDVEGVFDINSGRVYETMVVTKNSISKKSLRKLTKVLFKPTTYNQTTSNAQAPSTVGKVCAAEQKETLNSSNHTETTTTSPTLNSGSGSPSGSTNVENGRSVNVASEVLEPKPFDLSALASGGVSNRYTHIITFENDRYVNVALCINLLEKSVRVYSFLQPVNLKQSFDPTKPYIFSGKLNEKALAKLKKFIP